MQPDALQPAKLSDHVPHQLNLAPPPRSRAESSAGTELESLNAVHYPDLEKSRRKYSAIWSRSSREGGAAERYG
jgi:hypothetical protein